MRISGYWGGVIGGCVMTLFLVGFALLVRKDDQRFRARAQPAVATVVARQDTQRRDERGKLDIQKGDIYEFTAPSGQAVRFRSNITWQRPRRPIGERANILYDPGDPSEARLDDDSDSRGANVALWLSPLG